MMWSRSEGIEVEGATTTAGAGAGDTIAAITKSPSKSKEAASVGSLLD